MKTLLAITLIAAGGYGLVVAALYLLQESLIFHPQPPGRAPDPAHAQPFSLERGAVTLHGWIVNPDHAGPLVVYFGGNAEELSRLTGTFARLPATSVLVNYRGYGHSEGAPGADALIGDAAAVAAAARERLGGSPGDGGRRPLVLFGRSLGSGLAALTAETVAADGVILLSPYRSLTHLARRWMPFAPVGALLRHEIATTRALPALPRRVLVLYASDDMIIAAEESRALAARIEPPPQVVTFSGGHNVPLDHAGIWPAIEAFIAETR